MGDDDGWDQPEELTEELAKYIHGLIEGLHPDATGVWLTQYSATHRTNVRVLAREMMAKFDINLKK